MFQIVLLVAILILSLIWLLSRRGGSKEGFTIPGVKASDPEKGNLDDIGRAGSLHEYLTQLHKKLGPIVSFYWNKQRVVSVCSSQAFHDTRRLFDRPVSLFAQFEPLIGKNSIQYANGEIGRYRRKNHYDTALAPHELRTHCFEMFRSVIREKINTWKSNDGKSIPLHEEMLSMAMQSIVLAAFGLSMSPDDTKQIVHAYDTCWNEMEMRIQGKSMDSKGEIEFNKARNVFFEKVKEIIARRRDRTGDDSKCFIDYLLADNDTVISDEFVCDEVITMLVGGFHTTGNLLTWALYYLAKNQDVQQRVYDELVKTFDTDFPSCEQLDDMHYLTHVISETLRVSVLAPWAARVLTDDDIVVCGHKVPAGTPIIQALGVALQDENVWPNPHEFNPDRFNEQNRRTIPTLSFSPFGYAGKRICPGYRFAEYEAGVFLSGIIRQYKVTLTDPTCPVVSVHRLVTSPKDEIFVQLNKRNP